MLSPIEVLQPALVGVIQTSSEREHNSDAGPDSFLDLPQSWITCEFYDEHSVLDFFRGIAERRFSAVCFASNSLFNPAIHDVACKQAECLVKASEEGMGIVLLQQFLPEGSSRLCSFLPAFHQLEYNGIGYRRLDRISLVDATILGAGAPLTLDERTFGSREAVLWSSITPHHPRGWRDVATVQADGQEHAVLLRTRASRGRIIASALPLDWLADRRLLAYAIGLSVRSLGSLYVHSGQASKTDDLSLELLLGRLLAKGGHLSSVSVAHPSVVSSAVQPFADFSHLVVSNEWGWPELTALEPDRVRARLENGGSVAAYGSAATAGGRRILSVMRGRPMYLQLAHIFAAWFEVNSKRFLDAPTTQVRALAAAVRAVHDATIDKDEIPRSIAVREIDQQLEQYFRLRLNGTDNVDGHVLPTASLASAMFLLEHRPEEIAPLLRWIKRGAYISSFAAVQQAALWLPDVDEPHEQIAQTELERVYERLLAVRACPGESVQLDELLAMLSDHTTPMSRKAIIAESLIAFGTRETLVRAAVATRQIQNDLDVALAADHAPLEVICLLTAFLVRVHAAQELTAGSAPVDALLGIPTFDLSADHRQALEEARLDADALRERLEATRTFGAKAVGWAILLTFFVIIGICGFLVANLSVGSSTWIAIFVPILAVASAVLAYVGNRASKVECEPRMLRVIRELWRR
jgi:hypothetical protein